DHDEDWMTYSSRINSAFELCDSSDISKEHFKCLLFLSGLRKLCQTDVCCRFLRMIEASDEITLEGIANECINLDIKCDSKMNQQEPDGHNYVDQISGGTVPQNVSSYRSVLHQIPDVMDRAKHRRLPGIGDYTYREDISVRYWKYSGSQLRQIHRLGDLRKFPSSLLISWGLGAHIYYIGIKN
ncbi:hypothetical protein ACTXT7_016559, partial [Hymenolepis weldensis]